jgi:hypothetical protein
VIIEGAMIVISRETRKGRKDEWRRTRVEEA